MTLYGFIYQIGNPPVLRFASVNMKAAMNLYMNQFNEVSKNEDKVVCRWVVKKRIK